MVTRRNFFRFFGAVQITGLTALTHPVPPKTKAQSPFKAMPWYVGHAKYDPTKRWRTVGFDLDDYAKGVANDSHLFHHMMDWLSYNARYLAEKKGFAPGAVRVSFSVQEK